MNLRQRAEKYVARVCEYLPGKFYPYEATVTINPKDAYIAGFKAAIELAAEKAETLIQQYKREHEDVWGPAFIEKWRTAELLKKSILTLAESETPPGACL